MATSTEQKNVKKRKWRVLYSSRGRLKKANLALDKCRSVDTCGYVNISTKQWRRAWDELLKKLREDCGRFGYRSAKRNGSYKLVNNLVYRRRNNPDASAAEVDLAMSGRDSSNLRRSIGQIEPNVSKYTSVVWCVDWW